MSIAPGPRIYNLFPRLVGSMDRWPEHLPRIRELGFDWVYVNPWHYAGYSGSLYAVKDYYGCGLVSGTHPPAKQTRAVK